MLNLIKTGNMLNILHVSSPRQFSPHLSTNLTDQQNFSKLLERASVISHGLFNLHIDQRLYLKRAVDKTTEFVNES